MPKIAQQNTLLDVLGAIKGVNNVLSTLNGKFFSDAFNRIKVAEPQTLFDAQLTYDLQPLLFEAVAPASTAITHDATNRRAQISMTDAADGTEVYLQTYEYVRYQPGKSQEINITFNFGSPVSGVKCFALYGDGSNSFGFWQETDGSLQFKIVSTTSAGTQSIRQESWQDSLDGKGPSKKKLDITTDNILYIDFQALYVGKVRFGFVIDGEPIIACEFNNANKFSSPYIATANLPIKVGMLNNSGGLATNSITYNCCMVASSGGVDETVGYEFTTPDVSVTAGNGTRTHLVSVRPRTTFNAITNRTKLASLEIDLLVTGNNPVYWELCLGQAYSVGPNYANINGTYSAFEISHPQYVTVLSSAKFTL